MKNNKPTKLSDFDSYEKNPCFAEGINMVTKIKKGQQEDVYNNTRKEYGVYVGADKIKWIANDELPYKKIYSHSISELKDLSKPGLSVFCYILSNLQIKSDSVSVDLKDCMRYCGYSSHKNIYIGLVDLLNNAFIFRKTNCDSFYFININYFYNGSRFNHKERRKKSDE